LQWIDLHDVGFGECIVLGGRKRKIFMVDCGSKSRRLDEDWLFRDYVAVIAEKYEKAKERSFLLTHYHQDHYSGLPLLLRGNPHYFDRIYLPCCPVNEDGVPLLIELTILIEAFVTGAGTETVKMNGANLRLFAEICNLATTEVIYTLEAGDILEFDGEDYHVLWPPKEGYCFSPKLEALVEECNRLLRTSTDPCAESFLQLKEELCDGYIRCMESFASQTSADAKERQACVDDLLLLLDELNRLLPRLYLLRISDYVRALLCDRKTVMAVSEEINGSSLVLSSSRVLLTGDATPDTMEAISEDLEERYEIVKAPHHGTKSCWWDGFDDLEMTHLLISNGAGRGGGKIAVEYAGLNALHHCTGADHCAYLEEGNDCCNKDIDCSLCKPSRADPTGCRKPRCNLFLVSRYKSHTCNCEMLRGE
jgi:hypothetical protein